MSVQPPRDRHPDRVEVGGETLGPFQLLDEVASGELATFHRARPIEGGSEDATLVIKRLRREHQRSPEHRSALQREAELLTTLRASGFVRTLSFEKSPELYTVMEYVEGGNLALLLSLARRHDVETARFALPLIVGALRSLDYLHRGHDATGTTSLTHQAPVSRHILAGVDGNARLIDLTLAMGPATPRAPLCDHRLQPAEMAPEQVLAPSMVDSRADVFIAGITLWESLTGQRLFDGKNPLESQRRMLSGAVTPPSEVFSGVHRGFDRICMRALARPRGERYPTAGEMATELEEEAKRVGLFAEPADVGAWVRSTLALGRTTPRNVPRDYARSEAAQTMMGIGGPNPAILSIADSYRQANANGSRNTRRLRSTTVTNTPEPPARRESVVPIGDDDGGEDATSLITRGRTQPPPEPQATQYPDISQLGMAYPADEARDSGYDLRALPRSRGRIWLLLAMGVAAAGVFAFVIRQQSSGASAKPFAFGAAPVTAPAAALTAPEALPAKAVWPPVAAPALEPPAAREPAFAPPVAVPPAVPPVVVPPVPAPPVLAPPSVPSSVPALVEAPRSPSRRSSSAHKEAPAAAPAAPAKKKAEPNEAQRWDVSSTLSGGKAGWAAPTKPVESPGWANPQPPAPVAKQPAAPATAPNSDLPINPY